MSAKFKLFSFAVLTLGLAFGAAAVSAQERTAPAGSPNSADSPRRMEGRHRKRGGDRMMMRELRGIKLSDAQKEQIRIIQETYKPSQPEMDEMRMLMKAKRDGTATEEQKARITSLDAARKQRMETIHTQILGVLTSEQKAQIEKRKADREKRMAERRERTKSRVNRADDMGSPNPDSGDQ